LRTSKFLFTFIYVHNPIKIKHTLALDYLDKYNLEWKYESYHLSFFFVKHAVEPSCELEFGSEAVAEIKEVTGR